MIKCDDEKCLFMLEGVCFRNPINNVDGQCQSRVTVEDDPVVGQKRDVETREVPPPYRQVKHVQEFENIIGGLKFFIHDQEVDQDVYERATKMVMEECECQNQVPIEVDIKGITMRVTGDRDTAERMACVFSDKHAVILRNFVVEPERESPLLEERMLRRMIVTLDGVAPDQLEDFEDCWLSIGPPRTRITPDDFKPKGG